ncbi:MAG TPA: DoxX family protein [Candidatus Nanoarchaeia archaeon]|nr:DoxX family protein [Candidatus Nanoarchaeia archaeon]
MQEKQDYSPLILRVILGLMFVVAGANKLLNPQGIIGMLSGAGFFLPAFWGWLVILSEVLFGLTVLVGWKLRYTIWPLAIIMAVAIIMVSVPNIVKNPSGFFFHLLAIGALVSLFLTGAGAWSLGKE